MHQKQPPAKVAFSSLPDNGPVPAVVFSVRAMVAPPIISMISMIFAIVLMSYYNSVRSILKGIIQVPIIRSSTFVFNDVFRCHSHCANHVNAATKVALHTVLYSN